MVPVPRLGYLEQYTQHLDSGHITLNVVILSTDDIPKYRII